MIILRKILFYIFLGIFLVLCPLVVLYSLGYIYAPKTEERLVKTGLIRLETIPSGASVFLNNKRFNEKTPCTVGELLPNQYRIRVQLDGYQPWAKAVSVEAGKAAVFEKILLLPLKFRAKVLAPRSFQNLGRVPATRFLLLFGSRRIGDVVVFDWRNNTFHRLLAENDPCSREEILRYFVAKRSPFVLFEVQGQQKPRYLWCALEGNDLKARDISELFREGEPGNVQWENGDPKYLFAFYNGKLSRLDIEKKTVSPGFMEDLSGYGLYRGKVYGLKGSSLVRADFGAKKGEGRVVDGGHFLGRLFSGQGVFHMDFLSGDTVFFIGDGGKLITNLLPYQFMEKGLAGYMPDESLKKVLVWTQGELGLFDLGRTEHEESLFQRGPEIEWFVGKAKNIRQAYFVYGDSHALFCDENAVRLAETDIQISDPRGIAEVLKDSVPFYSEKTGKLYYLEHKEGRFVSLEIIPEERALERMLGETEKPEEREEK